MAGKPCRPRGCASRCRTRSPLRSTDLLRDVFDLRGCGAAHATTSRICRWGDSHARRQGGGDRRLPRADVDACVHGVRAPPAPAAGAAKQGRLRALSDAPRRRLLGLVRLDAGAGAAAAPSVVVLSQFWSNWGLGGSPRSREIADVSPLTTHLVMVEDAPGRTRRRSTACWHSTPRSDAHVPDQPAPACRPSFDAPGGARRRRPLRAYAAVALRATGAPRWSATSSPTVTAITSRRRMRTCWRGLWQRGDRPGRCLRMLSGAGT